MIIQVKVNCDAQGGYGFESVDEALVCDHLEERY